VTDGASGAADAEPDTATHVPRARRFLGLVELRRGEATPVALAAAYGFCLMASYNAVKPYREALGTSAGKLSSLWSWTLVICAVLLLPYWSLVGSFPRQRFIPWVHRFFEACFVALFFVLRDEKSLLFDFASHAFYGGLSAFNLLVISQFWGFVADVFTRDQGKRLFAWIAAGGTAGGLLASIVTSWSQDHHWIAPAELVWPTIILLELASLFALRLARHAPPSTWRPPEGVWKRIRAASDGLVLFGRSPYLLAIAAFMFVSLYTSAFVYDFQRLLVKAQIADRAAQTEYYANVNVWLQLVALGGQVVVSARLLATIGLGWTLALLPLAGVVGLGTFARHVTIDAIKWVQIGFKGVDYAIAKPAREALFTVVSRAEKYQSKTLIDAGLYRLFDWVDSLVVDALHTTGMATVAWFTCAASAVGVPLGALLARLHRSRQAPRAPAPPTEPVEEVDAIAEA
jgi:AAA family ATP:ADP antiporter